MTVVGVRKNDGELARVIDQALLDMRADGELEGILRKQNLWDERQRKLISFREARQQLASAGVAAE